MEIYRRHLFQMKQALLGDVLLFMVVETQLKECTETVAENSSDDVVNKYASSMDTTLLVTTLELVALEKLMAVRREMVVNCTVTIIQL